MPQTSIRQSFIGAGEKMAKNKSITRISNKKRGRPKVRFSIWGLIVIFALSFAACFVSYMIAANFDEDFFENTFDHVVVDDNDVQSDAASNNKSENKDEQQTDIGDKITNPVSKSETKENSYFESCCLVTDSTLLDIGKHTEFKDVIGSAELTAAGCNTITVESTYGNNTVYEILKSKKPSSIYIMLGSDIGTSTVDSMVKSYSELIRNLKGYLTESDIYIMQLPPVKEDAGAAVNNSMINEFNTKLLSIANTNNVYCIDTNTALKGVDGMIADGYRDPETGSLTESAYKAIADYVLCHTV